MIRFRRRKSLNPVHSVVGQLRLNAEHPTEACIGILASQHKSMTDGLCAELELLAEEPQARTQLVFLKARMNIAEEIDPRIDLRPGKN
jgi:hypothetical protein